MPTYEFTCSNGHDFDKFFRSMATAPSVVPCPVCGKPADRQMSAGAGLVFHGTGFYITDYGKDGKKDQKSAPGRRTESAHEAGADSSSHDVSDSASKVAEPKSDAGGGAGASSDSGPATANPPATVTAPASPAASSKATE